MVRWSEISKTWKLPYAATPWSTHLAWFEYAHNSLTISSGMSQAALGYQPPSLPAHKGDIVMPSIQVHLHKWCKLRREALVSLLHCADCKHHMTECHRTPAPDYQPGQKV